MGIQQPLHRRGINQHRFARVFLHFRRYLCCNQRGHPRGPSHPYITLLPRQAEHERFGARAIDQRALLFLDRQLAFLCLINRQSGSGLEIAVGPAIATGW